MNKYLSFFLSLFEWRSQRKRREERFTVCLIFFSLSPASTNIERKEKKGRKEEEIGFSKVAVAHCLWRVGSSVGIKIGARFGTFVNIDTIAAGHIDPHRPPIGVIEELGSVWPHGC